MGKIGRNQPCPCGSGKKYKHCCLANQQPSSTDINQAQVTLMAAIDKIQQAAEKKEVSFFELGVFIFFSNTRGDAWLLEVTQQDAVQVAKSGTAMEVPVEENEETIEMNWSHTFAIREKQFFMTDYADDQEVRVDDVPVQQVNAAMRRIKKRFTPEVLAQVHLASE